MGFTDVYDFVGSKVAWVAAGFPMEGEGPHYPLVGEVAKRDPQHEFRLGSSVGAARAALDGVPGVYTVVLNDEDILMGRLRKKHLAGADDALVETVMEPGPSTVRPTESAADVLKRLQDKDVSAIAVTSAKGHFLGIAHRTDLEVLVQSPEHGTDRDA